MPTRGSKDPNGRALRGRRAHTTFALLTDPARQIWNSFNNRANAGGADAPEAAVNGCLYDRFKSLYTKTATKPSLVIVPARFKSGTLYSQIPTNTANGDFTVTRNTAARRFDSAGLVASVASGIPRLDYYTSGGVTGCPALLVEPAATNLIFRSEEFATSPWGVLNAATVNVNTEISPDGTQNADRINLASGSVNSIVRQVNRTVANSTTYTLSCFYKNNTIASGEEFRLVFNNNASAPNNFEAIAFININAGTATYSIVGTSGTGYSGTATGRVENYGNGWYRFSLTFTVGTAGAAANADVYIGQANTANGRSYYAWGAQLETGSVATSYIPTTAASGSRSADVISVTGAVSGSIGQTQGTVYMEMQANAAGTGTAILTLGGSSSDNFLYIGKDSDRMRVRVRIGGAEPINNGATVLNGSVLKVAVAYQQSGNCAAYVNGNFLVSGTAVNNFGAALTGLGFGEQVALPITSISATMRIRAVALYTTRLTNAELAFITQP